MIISAWPWCIFPCNLLQDIFIQSKVIDIFPKFKMAAVAVLDFQFMWIWPFRRVDSPVFMFCTKFGSDMCYNYRDRRIMLHTFTRINFRFRLLVTWSSPHGRGASSREIWCNPIWSYWYFPQMKDGGRRHLGFVWVSHGTTHESSFVACTSCKNFVVIG